MTFLDSFINFPWEKTKIEQATDKIISNIDKITESSLELRLQFSRQAIAGNEGAVDVEAGSITISILILFAMLVAVIATIAANKWMMTRTLGVQRAAPPLDAPTERQVLRLTPRCRACVDAGAVMFVLYFAFVLQDLLRNFIGCSTGASSSCAG